ncbi:dethiobiotin synthase [Paenibacillus abyssi]|uniref:ATP-dependent dethiobiotin synthetase BioD n=1 Tax=Paenibacillus abyssi TaxID=1340531 RepID=A0A917FMB7_9BACL|nr:dethiobiotin synthase [Paenibacillus abyssi]GGF92440.1 ATP-dependent dethiobiotin synthetase BioD [Paenibacillus abyssi]
MSDLRKAAAGTHEHHSSRGWRGLFVTGTDTEVGKTFVTAAIAAALRQDGLDVGLWKPVQSGAPHGSADSDAHRLQRWSGVDDPPERIAPFSFEAPLAPCLAAREAGVELTLERLIAGGRPLMERHDALLVEGAGGLAAPLTAQELVVDMINELGMPVLIVARPGLGTVNHTLLTLAMLRQRRIPVVGVVLNDVIPTSPGLDPSRPVNGELIARYGNIPVLGRFPYLAGRPDGNQLLHEAARHIDLASIRAALRHQRD